MTHLALQDSRQLRAKPCACPTCRFDHGGDCEQQVCIDLYGECFTCRFVPHGTGSGSGTPDEFVAIQDECFRRWKLQHQTLLAA